MLERFRSPWSDRRAEVILGALACTVLAIIVFMIVFVAIRAWPSFHANGLSWFSAKGDVDQQLNKMVNSGANPTQADYQLGAWPLIYATLLTTALATGLGLIFAVLSAVFIVEFAPEWIRRLIVPIVRLLAAVPSVVYGLIGILVLAPFVGNHLVTAHQQESVRFVVQLSGTSLLVAVVILTVMITPIMVAITVDGLYAIPKSWKEGAVALGVNRWRAMWTVTVRAARPAIIAGAVLATARAVGEAIMISMVSGSKGFSPNPADGLTFIFEPLRTLAATIVEDSESINAPAMQASLYAMALLLLAGAFFLSLASWIAKQPLKKYGTRLLMATTTKRPDLPPLRPPSAPGGPAPRKRRRNEAVSTWRWTDRIGYVAMWCAGLLVVALGLGIVGYMAWRGVQYVRPSLIFSHPQPDLDQSKSGGFLDPLLGTVILTIIGITIATPLAVAAATWIVEYGRPTWLARIVDSGIEIIAGTPDIVIALFGLVLFQQSLFGWMSFTAEDGAVFGRSFLTAGAMMALLALPMVFAATREGLQSIPQHVREASYALGKTRAATIRRVLLPSVRANISTGAALGMGRIAGDTAIVVVLLGATLQLDPQGSVPGLRTLTGTGGTLTSYVYNNSPAGEGNAPQKAYAAAFVLLLIVIALNFAVDFIARRGARTGLETSRLGAR